MSAEVSPSVIVHGYKPVGDQRAPDGSIRIEGHFADAPPVKEGESFKEWARREQQKFITDAQAVFDVLVNNLPGGTLHELTILMLQRKLNLYVVKE